MAASGPDNLGACRNQLDSPLLVLFLLVRQITRYGFASLGFALAAYLIFVALVQSDVLDPTLSILVSQLSVLPFAFMASRKLVFRSKSGVLRNLTLYTLGYLLSMFLQWSNVFFFHSWLGFAPYSVAAWGIAISFPLFFLYQKLLFNGPWTRAEGKSQGVWGPVERVFAALLPPKK